MTDIQPIVMDEKAYEVYSHWHNGYITMTPVCFEQDGKRHFVANKSVTNDSLESYFHQLSRNDGRYFCMYCYKPDLMEFLEVIDRTKATFTRDTDFEFYGDFVDFGGNFNESSCAFRYNIRHGSVRGTAQTLPENPGQGQWRQG